MNKNYSIDKELILILAKEILEFESPTGFCFERINKIQKKLMSYGYKV